MEYYLDDAELWLSQPFDPIVPKFKGSAPGNEFWYAVLLSMSGKFFKDGLTILDYGSGNARLANFISSKLKNFNYYGLEPDKSPHIESSPLYNKFNQIKLGFIGSDLEREALEKSEIVILGSVFTHLEWVDSCKILDKFSNILKNNDGYVIFSCFLDKKYRCVKAKHYKYVKNQKTYHYVYITEDMIRKYCDDHSLNYEISKNYYQSRKNVRHQIVILSKK